MPRGGFCSHRACPAGDCRMLTDAELAPREEDVEFAKNLISEGWKSTSNKYRTVSKLKNPVTGGEQVSIKVGDLVFFDYGYGRILTVSQYWRKSGMEDLYCVGYFDSTTGKRMKCPDERCTSLCAICSRNLWADQLRPMSKHHEEFYRKEGLLND